MDSDRTYPPTRRKFIITSLSEHFNKNPIIFIGVVAFLVYKIFDSYAEARNSAPSAKIVELPNYKITKEFCKKPHKCTFEILLDDVLPEEDISRIANHIKKQVFGVDRVFISYRLSCFDLAKGYSSYWATSHFNPDLKISYLNYGYTSCGDFKVLAKKWNQDI